MIVYKTLKVNFNQSYNFILYYIKLHRSLTYTVILHLLLIKLLKVNFNLTYNFILGCI